MLSIPDIWNWRHGLSESKLRAAGTFIFSTSKPSDKNLGQTMKAKCWLQCFAIFKWLFEILWKCLVLCFSPNTSLYRLFSENWVCLNVQWQWSFLYLVPHPVLPPLNVLFSVFTYNLCEFTDLFTFLSFDVRTHTHTHICINVGKYIDESIWVWVHQMSLCIQ